MAATYETRDGDMLDLICFRHYAGRQSGAVEKVLDVNCPIGLADYPPILPRGLKIVLPDLPSTLSERPLVKLWD